MIDQKAIIRVSTPEQRNKLIQYASKISPEILNVTKRVIKKIQLVQLDGSSNLYSNFLSIMNQQFPYQQIRTPRTLCAKVVSAGDTAFRCYDCQLEDNSIICVDCFKVSNHRDHYFQKIKVSGGCCDCGDEQKWKKQGCCSQHNQKQQQVIIDEKKTQIFIRNMHYWVFLIFLFATSHQFDSMKFVRQAFFNAFANYLFKFNQNSIINNQMTFKLLQQKIQFTETTEDKNKFYSLKNLTVLQFVFRLHKNKQFCKVICNVFITIFPITQFKKALTLFYNKIVSQNIQIMSSEIVSISCQIYTSHKLIKQLIQNKSFKPIKLGHPNQNQPFQKIAQNYNRFYSDFNYLLNLYNNVGKQYAEYHIQQSNITHLCEYFYYVNNQNDDSISSYGIQKIYIQYLSEMLCLIKDNKTILKKAILDVVTILKTRQFESQKMSLYIPLERTLFLLLFVYLDGDMMKGMHPQFFQQMQIQKSLLEVIVQALLFDIRFYALVLSNRQTVERYYTFYALSVGKKPTVLPSMDFLFLNFCLEALSLLNKNQMQQENIILSQSFDKNIQYEANVSYQQNKMNQKIQFCLPIYTANKILLNEIQNSNDGAYDRRKALGYVTDYIGILHQILIASHHQTKVRCLLNMETQQQIINLYGNILKSLKNVKFDVFKSICLSYTFKTPFFSKFVQDYCKIQNGKITLRQEKQNYFSSIHLPYLKMNKSPDFFFSAFYGQNIAENPYNKILVSPMSQQQKLLLQNSFFNRYFIMLITDLMINFLDVLKNNPDIVQSDTPAFISLIEELVRLNFTLKNSDFLNVFDQLTNQSIFDKFPAALQKHLYSLTGKSKIQNQQQIKERKMSEQATEKQRKMSLKAKKLQKFKMKQNKVINSLNQDKQTIVNQKQQNYDNICMFCKLSDEKQPLSILCYRQKSTIISRLYLNCNTNNIFFSTCGHKTHLSCLKKTYQNRQYFYCNICKTSCNYSLKNPGQQISKLKKQLSKEAKQQSQKNTLSLKAQTNIRRVTSQFQRMEEEVYQQLKQENQSFEDCCISEGQQMLINIAYLIFYGIVIDYKFFVRSVAKPTCFMFGSLINKNIQTDRIVSFFQQIIDGSQKSQTSEFFWDVLKMIILSVISLLGKKQQQKNERWEYRKIAMNIPKKIIQSLETVIAGIRLQSSLDSLQNQTIQPFQPIKFKQLPESLADLSKQIGECPNCNQLTNQIAICMLCNFKSCLSCPVYNLTDHASQVHAGASIFIRVDEGFPIYLGAIKNRPFHSLYKNFLGQQFFYDKQKKDRSQYRLVPEQLQKIKTHLTQHKIQQTIRYMLLQYQQVSYDNP